MLGPRHLRGVGMCGAAAPLAAAVTLLVLVVCGVRFVVVVVCLHACTVLYPPDCDMHLSACVDISSVGVVCNLLTSCVDAVGKRNQQQPASLATNRIYKMQRMRHDKNDIKERQLGTHYMYTCYAASTQFTHKKHGHGNSLLLLLHESTQVWPAVLAA